MTAQACERLIYKGKDYSMCNIPLYSYLRQNNIKLEIQEVCTALHRGFVGQWELADDNKLYLLALYGTLADGSKLSIHTLFPEAKDKVFADWFSDEIRLPLGKMLTYVHMGFQSVTERDMILTIENGVLTGERIVENEPLPPPPPPPPRPPESFWRRLWRKIV